MAPAPKFSPQEQQERIISGAIECINATSITDFTMAKIAATAGLSMGSVYKFFQSKEDIIVALAHRSFKHVSSVFDQVLKLPLRTPEKIIAVCLISPEKMQLFPFCYELESYATNDAVLKKASPQWTQTMIEASTHCENAFRQTLCQGINSGELESCQDHGQLMEEIIVSTWSMAVGYEQVQRVRQSRQIIEGTSSVMDSLKLDDPIVRSMVRLINSYPWKYPLDENSLRSTESELIKLDLR